MQLHIENIGKLAKADISLNGITVICGDNNTGKSTVGKTLFCVFNSCFKMNENIIAQISTKLLKDVEDLINSSLRNDYSNEEQLSFSFILESPFKCNATEFIRFAQALSDDNEIGLKQVNEFIMAHLESSYYQAITAVDSLNQKVYSLIKAAFKSPVEPYKISRVKNFFNVVFDKQFIRVGSKEASVMANIQGNKFNVTFDSSGKTDLSLNFDFTNSAVFIDSPDEYRISLSDWDKRRGNANINSLESLVTSKVDNEYSDSSDVERTVIEQRLVEVSKILNKAIKGKLKRIGSTRGESNGGFEFEGSHIPVNISNLSTGVKSLLLFKTICEGGKLNKRDVLILDEPEIHLHPEWQLVYAEAIVLLQKELDLTVLITSHSPAFVRAIECYCDYYNRMSNLDVYKTKKISDFEYTLENLSYKEYGVSELYDDFSKPYLKLDKMLEDKYN